jgi:small conductance mechanosensitive channel
MTWHRLFAQPASWRPLVEGVAISFVFAWIASQLARAMVRGVLTSLLHDGVAPASHAVRALLRLFGYAIFAIVFALLLVPSLEFVGLQPRAGVHLRTLAAWAFDSGLRVLLICAVAYAIIRMVGISVARFEHEISIGTGLDALERAKRAKTLGAVLTSATTVLVLVTAVLMILREFRIDISPAVTGAGIVGVALGFGAQSLVKDIIGGFFLILENQVRVGDVASINGTGGLVEAINLRTIVLRDEQGTVHVFPNGSINTLANLTKDFSYYVINLPIAYGEDPEMVTALLTSIADGLREEDRFKPFVLGPLEIIGVDDFTENAYRLKVRIKTAPLRQWLVGRELRKRIIRELTARGIQFWSTQKTIVMPAGAGGQPPAAGSQLHKEAGPP